VKWRKFAPPKRKKSLHQYIKYRKKWNGTWKETNILDGEVPSDVPKRSNEENTEHHPCETNSE
jgi:hypothetical protein